MTTEQHRDIEYYPAATTRRVPFSAAVRVGNMLYLSGQIGIDDSGNVAPGGVEAETRQTMENMRATLERHGSSLDRVYVTCFDKHLPARSAFGTTGLALGARVEIECTAVLD